MHLNNTQESREFKFLGSQSGQALIWSGYCRKKEEGEGRVQPKVGKTSGTLPVAELSMTVSAVFQSKQSSTACSDLFIYLIYGPCLC